MIVPKRGNMVYGIENVIISLYAKVIKKTVYIAVGLRRDGKKEVLGLFGCRCLPISRPAAPRTC